MLKLALKLVTGLSAAVALAVVGTPVAGADVAARAAGTGHGSDVAHGAPAQESASMAWSYTIRPSCGGWEGPIRTGANYWGDVTEGGGTPVECQNSAITDCGFEPIEVRTADGRLMIVGCNYGMGQLIKLFPGAVNDPALLAAHEFGHNWYGHSYNGCASWASPTDVMATTMC